jgi:hypothetical protein
MFETVRFSIVVIFASALFTAIGVVVYARVPSDFLQCKTVYSMGKNIDPIVDENLYTKKEKECIKSREDLASFEVCLAQAAIKNHFPVTSLLVAGKIAELRNTLNVTCIAVVY